MGFFAFSNLMKEVKVMPRKRFPLMISDYERSQLLSIATTFKISEARAARLAIVLLAKNLENEDFKKVATVLLKEYRVKNGVQQVYPIEVLATFTNLNEQVRKAFETLMSNGLLTKDLDEVKDYVDKSL